MSATVPDDKLRREPVHLLVVVALDPRYQTQYGKDLRLYAQSNVVIFCDVINSEWNSSPCPQHHHSRLEPGSIVSTIVDNDLGDQLRRTINKVPQS